MNKWELFTYKNTKIWSCVDIQILVDIGSHVYMMTYLLITLILHSLNKDRARKENNTHVFL